MAKNFHQRDTTAARAEIEALVRNGPVRVHLVMKALRENGWQRLGYPYQFEHTCKYVLGFDVFVEELPNGKQIRKIGLQNKG